MAKYTLKMVFGATDGTKINMALADCKEVLTSQEINNVMDVIIAQNVFESKFGDLVSKVSAKTVVASEEEIIL